MQQERNILESKWAQTKEFFQEHKRFVPVLAFIAGLSLDVVSLKRFDHWFTLTQHGIYLALIALIYSLEFLNAENRLNTQTFGPEGTSRLGRFFWKHQEELIHFLFGSLLSANTVFYLKSGSLINSFFFMLVILACLFANEVERFRRLGLMMRGGLLCLCMATYFIYVIPITLGSIGTQPFLLSMTCTAMIMGAIWYFVGHRFDLMETAKKFILFPAIAVISTLSLFLSLIHI